MAKMTKNVVLKLTCTVCGYVCYQQLWDDDGDVNCPACAEERTKYSHAAQDHTGLRLLPSASTTTTDLSD